MTGVDDLSWLDCGGDLSPLDCGCNLLPYDFGGDLSPSECQGDLSPVNGVGDLSSLDCWDPQGSVPLWCAWCACSPDLHLPVVPMFHHLLVYGPLKIPNHVTVPKIVLRATQW